MKGAVVSKTALFWFHMKRGFRVRILGEVNTLYYLRYLQNHYYKHYNKSEFEAPEIHDTDLKFQITVCMVRVHMSAHPVREYVLWIYLLSDERILYVQHV